MKRIGILGGTFNPVHNGHLAIAQAAYEKLKLDRVLFVPSKLPVHKSSGNVISATKRMHMLKVAIKSFSYFEICDFEVKRDEKSYSFDTVDYLKKIHPQDKFYFIIGGDNVEKLYSWKKIDRLLKLVTFACVSRPGSRAKTCVGKCRHIEMPELDISSSYIRQRIKRNQPISFLVPEAVSQYILRNKIYF